MINRDVLADYFARNCGGRNVCVTGYGAEGAVCAECLRGAEINAVVGVRPGPSWERASMAGFEVYFISDAVKMSDIVLITHPPAIFEAIFPRFVRPYLRAGQELWFLDSNCLLLLHPDCPRRDEFALPEGVKIRIVGTDDFC